MTTTLLAIPAAVIVASVLLRATSWLERAIGPRLEPADG
jgi:hypothetical protein